MKAAALTALRTVEIQDVPDPEISRETDVLLDVNVVGVCGSDMHYYRTGRIGEMVVEYPFRVGHEFSGTVREVGPAVRNLRPGQRVAVDPLVWCGQCEQCLSGRRHTCLDQVFLGCPGQIEGCLSERIVMPAACCSPLPDGVSSEQGALVEPFSIGLYSQRLAGDVNGKAVGIFGAGPIGLCVLAACRAAGARAVYVTDIREYRAEMARQFRADWTGNPESSDVVEEILAIEPNGLDAAIECAGEQDTVDQAVALLKPGGTLVLTGIPEFDEMTFPISTIRRKELTIQNVRRQNECVEPAIEMVASRAVVLDEMVTHRYSLEETQTAFDTIADYKDNAVKAVIEVCR